MDSAIEQGPGPNENEKEEDTAREEQYDSEAVSPMHVEDCDRAR